MINDPPKASTNPVFALQRPKESQGQRFLGNEKFPPCVLRSAGQACFRAFSLSSELGDVFRHCSVLKRQVIFLYHTANGKKLFTAKL